MKKKLFKHYIYGYLNEYYATKLLLLNENNKSYKKLKIEKSISYLNLPKKLSHYLNRITIFISILETFISIFILFFLFFYYVILLTFKKKHEILNQKLVFGINDEFYFHKFVERTNINKKEFNILYSPFNNSNLLNENKISILSGISFVDLFKSFIFSIEIIFFLYYKFGYRDIFFRGYSSFNFFITSFFVYKSSLTNKYFSDAQYCRWAHLLGNIKHESYLVQHGIILDKIKLHKIGTISFAYYINDEQKFIFEKLLLKNIPECIQVENKIFYNIFPKDGIFSILLICNSLYFDKEQTVIKILCKLNLCLYVKPHPNESPKKYVDENLNNKFILLKNYDIPKVDLVISYPSSLAYDFVNNGTHVLFYQDKNFDITINNLVNNYSI